MKNLIAAVLLLACGAAQAEPATDLECDKCIQHTDISAGAITNGKIQKGAVITEKIHNRAVTTGKISDGAVTIEKVAPEIANSIDTYCPPGEGVIGKDSTGNYVCEFQGVYVESYIDTDYGIASAYCPSGFLPISASCNCDYDNGNSNLGVLFDCGVYGNGGLAACFDYLYSPYLNDTVATVAVLCGQESSAALPSVASANVAGANDELTNTVNRLRKRREAYKSRLPAQ